jgi:hypothetical protein
VSLHAPTPTLLRAWLADATRGQVARHRAALLFEQLSGLDVSAEALASAAALAAETEAADMTAGKAGSSASGARASSEAAVTDAGKAEAGVPTQAAVPLSSSPSAVTSGDTMLLDGDGSEGGTPAGASAGSAPLPSASALLTRGPALAELILEEAVSGSLRLGLRRDPVHGCFTFWVSRAFVEESRKRLAAVRKGEEHEASALMPPALSELLAAALGASDAAVTAAEAAVTGGVNGSSGVAAIDINAALRCPHGQLHPDKRLRKRVWAETWRRLLALSPAYAGSTAFPADAGAGALCRECEELETSVREGDRAEIARRSAELTG